MVVAFGRSTAGTFAGTGIGAFGLSVGLAAGSRVTLGTSAALGSLGTLGTSAAAAPRALGGS